MDSCDIVPPYLVDSEKYILAYTIITGDKGLALKPSDFSRQHRPIWECIQELEALDLVLVTNALRNSGKLDEIGGKNYLSEIVLDSDNIYHVNEHVKDIQEATRRRRTKLMVARAADYTSSPAWSPKDVLHTLSSQVEEITGLGEPPTRSKETLEILRRQLDQPEIFYGLSTGFQKLDHYVKLEPGSLYLLAARPAVGKTCFALDICRHIGINLKEPVLFACLEMTVGQLYQRLASALSNVFLSSIRLGCNDDEKHKVNAAYDLLEASNLHLADQRSVSTVFDVETIARQVKPKLVIVDYLQLLSAKGKENRTQEVGEISRGLKKLAMRLGIPIIALSQLSRRITERMDKTPMLSDLRESGSLEQDADVVMFLHRPNDDRTGETELRIAKNRQGELGTIDLIFRGSMTTFLEK